MTIFVIESMILLLLYIRCYSYDLLMMIIHNMETSNLSSSDEYLFIWRPTSMTFVFGKVMSVLRHYVPLIY